MGSATRISRACGIVSNPGYRVYSIYGGRLLWNLNYIHSSFHSKVIYARQIECFNLPFYFLAWTLYIVGEWISGDTGQYIFHVQWNLTNPNSLGPELVQISEIFELMKQYI